MAGILQLSGQQTVGPPPGQISQGTPVVGYSKINIELEQVMSNVENITQVVLTTFATIAVPNGVQGVIIIPPAGNSVGITLKGVSGDTGVALNTVGWSVLSLAPSILSFVLTPASPMSAAVTVQFF